MSLASTASGTRQGRPSGLPRALAHDPRYRVLTEIGRGGMGMVYAAIDRETGEQVAIKVLSSPRDGLLRFKNEFRLASRLTHPNLVALYDLIITDQLAYFVMEYAPGVDLRKHVRNGLPQADLPRLYAALTQMLDALECLSQAGIVHRDLKPSNVLVSDKGHVKLLDFGLSAAHDTPDFSAASLAGTPTYMSPEQIDGRPLGFASDLYALGVIVYELLVGQPPFTGNSQHVLHAHRHAYPVPPSDRVPDVPPDLELWCLRLLAKRPEERFGSVEEARAALLACGAPATRAQAQNWGQLGSGQYRSLRVPLIGRDSERALLEALLDRVREGASQMALISGESGIGKTALAEALLEEAQDSGCVVLRGSCREHESLTYNAFDAVVDGAATAVEKLLASGALSRDQVHEALENLPLLGKLFPVLHELEPLATGDAHKPPPGPPVAGERDRAFALVKRLIERVTAQRPLVILMDDLHWADEDSMQLLHYLIASPGTRGLMIVATAWPTDQATPLERWLKRQREAPDGAVTQLTLGPLGPREGAEVVDVAAEGAVAPTTLATIQREAAGNAFLLVELARLHLEEKVPHPTVREILRRRLEILDEDERAMVEVAAVAPGPVDGELLHLTLERYTRPHQLEGAGLRRLVGLKILREAGVRARSLGGVRYDFYHHRIRETVRAEIPHDRRRRLHRRLAETIAELRPDDHESLVRELMLAGEDKKAAAHAEKAAEAAMARLAHARAAELYRLALRQAKPADAPRLRIRLGEALEGVARFAEAAQEYQAGLSGEALAGVQRTSVKLHLANCLLHVGRLDESGQLVEECLGDLGRTTRRPRLVQSLVVLWLLLRSLVAAFFSRKPRQVDTPETQARMLAYALAVPHFQFASRNAEQLEYALRFRLLGGRSPSHEIRHEATAMGLVLFLPLAHLGGRIARRIARHFQALEESAALMSTERARAWLPLLRAVYAMVGGRPDRALKHFEALRDHNFARTGYVALQRHNALILAGAYDSYVTDLTQTTHHDGALKPLDIARLAYIERVRGHVETARRLIDDIAAVNPDELPWTHRSLFTYQLIELRLLDGETAEAARLAKSLLPRIRRAAVSPTTGAFESADAVARAYCGEAGRLWRAGDHEAAKALVREAARALKQTPLLEPPLFAARLVHDRAIVQLALGKIKEAMRLFDQAARMSRDLAVPCFRLRLCEDLLALLPPEDPRRAELDREVASLCAAHGYVRRSHPAPWLNPLG